MIDRAAKFAEQAHKGAHRKGTRIPYIVHPLETALIASMLTSEDKSKTWIERKGHTLEHLKTASPAEKILTMADKLSNIRSMARDYLLVGEELWQRFNMKDREKQAWYYTSMIDLLKDLNETPEYQEYVRLCGKVFGGIAGCCSLQKI